MPKSRQRPASCVVRSAGVALVDAPYISGAARGRRRGRPRGSSKSKPIEVAGAFDEQDEGGSASTTGLCRPTPDPTVMGVGDGSVSRDRQPGVRSDGEGRIQPAEIQRLQEKIRKYKPGGWSVTDVGNDFVGPRKIRLGVIGVMGSGKSALLNSLFFAFTGEWMPIFPEGTMDFQGGHTMCGKNVKLTDYITFFDTRGFRDFSESSVHNAVDTIWGKRGIDLDLKSEKIDCPIFVYSYSPDIGTKQCRSFLHSFCSEIKESHGDYPIMVVTFSNYIANRHSILTDIRPSSMDERSLFFIENYTAVDHEMKKDKHIVLLKILEACILRADDNITYQRCKEREYLKMYLKATTEAEMNDYDNLPERAERDGTDNTESIDHAIGIFKWFGRDTRSPSTVVIPTEESRDQVFDSTLKTIAKRIHNDVDIDSLGGELGFEPPEIQRYIQSNKQYQNITYMGTLNMLRDWRSRTKRSEECEDLRRALNASNHLRLADELL